MPEENGGNKRAGLLEKSPRRRQGAQGILQGKGQRGAGGPEGARKDTAFPLHLPRQTRRDPRNRALSVLTNVFFHLHPPKSIATPCATATPGAWGVSLSTCSWLLTFTGVLLMFYYHPTKIQAFRTFCTWKTTSRSGNCCVTCTAGPRTDDHRCVVATCFESFSPARTSGRESLTGALASF